ncbi:MAG: hypothetical protein LBR46_05575 [Prevotella sp.]|jgi:uncharacterized membrane protein|nr:hypothetical protein [Prevotella sp.]
MKKLNTNGVKTLKVFHLIFVMMWVIGVVTMGIIYFAYPQSGDELYSYFYIMRLVDDILVIPGAVLTTVTGIIYGTFANWGFFKHRWITVKWIVSIFVIVVGTFIFSPWLDNCLEIANSERDTALSNMYVTQYTPLIGIFSGMQSTILIFLVVVSVFKPWKKKKL